VRSPLTGESIWNYQSHLAAATLDSCFEHKTNYIRRSLMGSYARLTGERSAKCAFTDFQFDPVGLNHDSPHHSSEEILSGGREVGAELRRLPPGGNNDLLDIGRRIFWLSQLSHEFTRRL
jgi:hypothetical protein